MYAFRFWLKSAGVAGVAALWLSACGGHGMVPTPAEQTQLQSAAGADPTGQPFSQTLSLHGFGRVLRGITLSAQQQSQLQTMVRQFRLAHPPGSAFDPQALQALHEKMFAVLTPQQQMQFQQNMAQMRGGLRSINLTDAQRTQIRQLVQQFRQAHPPGSTFDPQARQQLRDQIRSLLTPQQREQLQAPTTAQPESLH